LLLIAALEIKPGITVKKKIFAIPGNTRQNSSNHRLTKAIAILYSDKIDMNIFEGLASLPAFNPNEADRPIPEVTQFRQHISEADGVIICTPNMPMS
jgi:NAD(P)H-dependent FMN reductase